MPNERDVRISRRAEADLDDIAAFTIERFGIEQARRYRDGLAGVFMTLALHPLRGRSAARLVAGLRRHDYEAHVVFYRPDAAGVFIVRVLHQHMDFERHAMSDE